MNNIEYNKKLIEIYPFLLPRNRFTDKVDTKYDYSFTELDAMPVGWRKAFGITMCEELLEILKESNYVYDYRIVQIKEKYGQLRWYSNGVPRSISEKYNTLINKYEKLSMETCIKCGKAATRISLGWISPWCDECKVDNIGECIPLEEYFKEYNEV